MGKNTILFCLFTSKWHVSMLNYTDVVHISLWWSKQKRINFSLLDICMIENFWHCRIKICLEGACRKIQRLSSFFIFALPLWLLSDTSILSRLCWECFFFTFFFPLETLRFQRACRSYDRLFCRVSIFPISAHPFSINAVTLSLMLDVTELYNYVCSFLVPLFRRKSRAIVIARSSSLLSSSCKIFNYITITQKVLKVSKPNLEYFLIMTRCSCRTRGITLKAIVLELCRMMAPDRRALVPHTVLLFF